MIVIFFFWIAKFSMQWSKYTIEYLRVILYHMVETYGGQKIGKNEDLPKN